MKTETKQQNKPTTLPSVLSTASSLTKTKKTCTTLICELTRLKSQQKYLECNQVKLNPNHFEDVSSGTSSTASPSPTSSNATPIKQFVLEIEQLKVALEEELNICRAAAKRDVEDMWILVNDIRQDVLQPERLRDFSVQVLRERIIGINTHLNRLSTKNAKQLSDLQAEELRLESESRVLLK